MSNSIIITTTQEFETFIRQVEAGSYQDVEFVKISNVTIPPGKIQELSKLLPKLKKFDYNEPTLDIYNSYSNEGEEEDDEEDEDEHGACGCCRTDRYE